MSVRMQLSSKHEVCLFTSDLSFVETATRQSALDDIARFEEEVTQSGDNDLSPTLIGAILSGTLGISPTDSCWSETAIQKFFKETHRRFPLTGTTIEVNPPTTNSQLAASKIVAPTDNPELATSTIWDLYTPVTGWDLERIYEWQEKSREERDTILLHTSGEKPLFDTVAISVNHAAICSSHMPLEATFHLPQPIL